MHRYYSVSFYARRRRPRRQCQRQRQYQRREFKAKETPRSQASSRLQLKPLVISSPKQGKLCLKITLTRHEIAAIMQIQNKASPTTFCKSSLNTPPSPPFYNVVSGPSPTLYHGGGGRVKRSVEKVQVFKHFAKRCSFEIPRKKGV